MSLKNYPILKLTFSREANTKLLKSVLELPGSNPISANRGVYKEFVWRQGAMAVCLFWIRYVLHSKTKNVDLGDFVFEGFRDHPAKTLWELLDNSPERVGWLVNMYGKSDGEVKTRLNDYIDRERENYGTDDAYFKLKVYPEIIPPQSVKILDHKSRKEITEWEELEQMAKSIEEQWGPIETFSDEVAPAQLVSANPLLGHSTEVAETPSSQSKAHVDKSLADRFSSMTIKSINRYIIAALRSPPGKAISCSDLADQFLEPATLVVLTEKLVHGPLQDFVDFYLSDHNSIFDIKKAVALVIASSPDLRIELASKAVKSSRMDFDSWFHVFSYYCPREVALEVERAFNVYAKKLASRSEYKWAPLRSYSTLIRYFAKFECVGVIFTLTDMWFEHASPHQEFSPPRADDVREFTALIGEERFRSRCESSIRSNQNPEFFRQLLTHVPAQERQKP